MKKLYFAAILGCSVLNAAAEYVTPEQALARLNEENSGQMRVRVVAGAELMRELPELYVFSTASGYMILPADDVARPVLAYGDEFVADGNPVLEYWLNFYAEEIRAAKQAPQAYSYAMTPRKARKAVAPMVKAKWNQNSPFNDLCPLINGERSVTGCVATAMAQVMYYHKWPVKGVGSHSYTWETGGKTLSFNYGSTTFDWDNMLDSYSGATLSTERTAVATLMYAAGVSVDMNYTARESGAVSQGMVRAFVENFNYDKAVWYALRNCYTSADWEDLIYGEVAAGRPVLYSGQSASGAHQFVVDGYSSDGYFHLNWGWGGQSDGYFTLSALNPSSLGIGAGAGGYNYGQEALIGLQKPVDGSTYSTVMYNISPFMPETKSLTIGQIAKFSGMFVNYGCLTNKFSLGVKFSPVSNGEKSVILPWGYVPSECPSGYGFNSLEVTIPTSIPDGLYNVTPVYRVGDSEEWLDIVCDLTVNHSVRADISGTQVKFSTPDAPSVSASGLKLLTPLYWGMPCGIKFSLTNNNDCEFNGAYVPVLLSAGGNTQIALGERTPVTLAPGETSDIELNVTFSATSTPSAGSYTLAIVHSETNAVISPAVPVQLQNAPAQTSVTVSNFAVESTITDRSAVKFNMNVNCEKGYFAGQVQVVVANRNGNTLAWSNTPIVYVEEGNSTGATATLDLSGLSGGSYIAVAFLNGKQQTNVVTFTLPSQSAGIDEVTSESSSESRELYDLQGRRVVNPSRRGIYLTPDGKKILL